MIYNKINNNNIKSLQGYALMEGQAKWWVYGIATPTWYLLNILEAIFSNNN